MSPVNLLEERLVQATQNSKGMRRPRAAFILPRSTYTLLNVTCNSLQYTEFYERFLISFLQAFIVTLLPVRIMPSQVRRRSIKCLFLEPLVPNQKPCTVSFWSINLKLSKYRKACPRAVSWGERSEPILLN